MNYDKDLVVILAPTLIKEDRGEDVCGAADAERPRHGTAFGRVNKHLMAEAPGITEVAVRKRLKRAFDAMRTALEGTKL